TGSVPANLPDDVAGLRGVASEMDLAAASPETFGELLHQLWQSLEVGAAAAFELSAAGFEIEIREGRVTPAAQSSHRLSQRALQLGVVQSLVDAPREVAAGFRHALGVFPGLPRRSQPGSTPGPSILSRRTPRRGRRHSARARRMGAPELRPAPGRRCRC